MSVEQMYRTNAQAILLAARDLEEALDAGDDEDIPSLTNSLLSAALAREAGGVVAGFRADDRGSETAPAPATLEEELSLALTELEIGEVLLAGSAAAPGAPTDDRAAPPSAQTVPTPAGIAPTSDRITALSEAIDQLEDASNRLTEAGAPTLSSLFGDRRPDPEEFFTQLPKTVDQVIERTAGVGRAALTGLTKIPAAQLEPVFTSALSLVPDVNALARAAMRAIARALDALAKLAPEKLRKQVQAWAKEWWEQRADAIFTGVVRRALSVAELEAVMKATVDSARQKPHRLEGQLQEGASRLLELDERHARLTKVIERIVSVLSRLIGPLVALVPAGAPWIYLSGGGGLLTAIGVAVWVGRDYLDTGVPFEQVLGVRAVLATVTG